MHSVRRRGRRNVSVATPNGAGQGPRWLFRKTRSQVNITHVILFYITVVPSHIYIGLRLIVTINARHNDITIYVTMSFFVFFYFFIMTLFYYHSIKFEEKKTGRYRYTYYTGKLRLINQKIIVVVNVFVYLYDVYRA